MKKVRIIILFMTLFLGMFFAMPAKVFASDEITAEDWYNHISQFDFGFAKGEVDGDGGITIVEEPSHEFDGWYIDYYYFYSGHDNELYFEPELWHDICTAFYNFEDLLWYLGFHYYGVFDGHFYWNFEQKYWQVEYYETFDVDYYIERIDELENEIQDLEDEISSLEDEISSLEDEISSLEDEISSLEDENSLLEDEISSLEDEIQQLEDALDLEYDRGYNEGYEIGYNEGLLVENNDITKWFVPLIVIIIVVGIIEPIIILKRRG